MSVMAGSEKSQHQMQQQVHTTRRRLMDAQVQLEAAEKAAANIHYDLVDKEEALQNLQEAIEQSQEQVKTIARAVDGLQQLEQNLNHQSTASNQKKVELTDVVRDLIDRIRTARLDKGRCESKVDESKKLMQEKLQELEEHMRAFAQFQQRAADLFDKNISLVDKAKTLSQLAEMVGAESKELQNQLESIVHKISMLESVQKAAKGDEEAAKTLAEQASKKVVDLDSLKTRVEREIDTIEQAVRSLVAAKALLIAKEAAALAASFVNPAMLSVVAKIAAKILVFVGMIAVKLAFAETKKRVLGANRKKAMAKKQEEAAARSKEKQSAATARKASGEIQQEKGTKASVENDQKVKETSAADFVASAARTMEEAKVAADSAAAAAQSGQREKSIAAHAGTEALSARSVADEMSATVASLSQQLQTLNIDMSSADSHLSAVVSEGNRVMSQLNVTKSRLTEQLRALENARASLHEYEGQRDEVEQLHRELQLKLAGANEFVTQCKTHKDTLSCALDDAQRELSQIHNLDMCES